jgi:phosphoserine phosphatase RsbU/P
MASLHVDKGPLQGQVVLLDQDKTVLGRNPDCHVVIPTSAVSRWHAQILRLGNRYYIEDLKSRNGTAVNDDEIAGRTALDHGDRVRVCDFEAVFCSDAQDIDSNSTIVETALGSGSDLRLETQPAARLAALLGITAKLSKTLQLDALLPEIADGMLELFHLADRCFFIMTEEGTGNLLPKAVRTRKRADGTPPPFSHTLVRQCLQTAQALLLEDAGEPLPTSASVIESQIRSVMVVPVSTSAGKPIGVIQLDTQDRSKKFNEEDLRLLWGVAQQASVALENARLHESSLGQERVKRDLELARQVQRSFLPQKVPQVDGYEFFAYYEAALAIGGDYYDFIPLPDGRLAIAVGDVAGKGIPAALLMAKLSSEARTCLLTERDPATACARLNDALWPHTSSMDRFVTLILAVLDPIHHTLTLVNAGHPLPLVHRAGKKNGREAMSLEAVGPFLGLELGATYLSAETKLGPGDSLILFSDGISDAQSAAGAAFRVKGIQSAIGADGPDNPRQLGEGIIDHVAIHAAGVPQYDDMTLLCFGRRD